MPTQLFREFAIYLDILESKMSFFVAKKYCYGLPMHRHCAINKLGLGQNEPISKNIKKGSDCWSEPFFIQIKTCNPTSR